MERGEWRRIVTDWAAAFPELRDCGRRRIGKRVGPFYVGVLVEAERSGTEYLPLAHAHNLAIESECLTLCFRRGPRFEWTTPAKHASVFPALVRAVDREAALPLRRAFGWSELVRAARTQPESHRDPFPLSAFEFLVVAAAWYQNASRLQEALAMAEAICVRWPERMVEAHGGMKGFLNRLRRVYRARAELERVVREQSLKHGVSQVPESALGDSGPPNRRGS